MSENEIGVNKNEGIFGNQFVFICPMRRHSQTASAPGRPRLDGTGRGGTGRHWTVQDGTGLDGTGLDGTGRDGTGREGGTIIIATLKFLLIIHVAMGAVAPTRLAATAGRTRASRADAALDLCVMSGSFRPLIRGQAMKMLKPHPSGRPACTCYSPILLSCLNASLRSVSHNLDVRCSQLM